MFGGKPPPTYLKEAGIALRPPGAWGRQRAGKTGQRGDHRLCAGRTSHRVGTDPLAAKPANEVTTDFGAELAPQRPRRAAARSQSIGQCLRTLPGSHRSGALARPQRHGDLAGSGGRPRLRRRLSERQALRAQACAASSRRKPARSSKPRPAKKLQVDYGTGPMVRDPHTGKYRRTRLFVLTLGYSRKCGSAAGVPLQFPDLGRVAREGLSPAGRRDTRGRAR